MSKLPIQKKITNEMLGAEIRLFKFEVRQIGLCSNVSNLHFGGVYFKSWTGQ
jgi:hypothetical protein